MIFTVSKEYDGRLLRDFLRTGLHISRKTLVRLKGIDDGILLCGEQATVRATVHAGDIVALALEDRDGDENPYVAAEGSMPPILYEDDAVIAVNKPQNMPTHTSFGHYGDALSNAVCGYLKSKGKPFVFRAINRLDRDTSGIVLIAKNRYYANILSDALKNGAFKKEYIAVVHGKTETSGKIEGYIKREEKSVIKRQLLSQKTEGGNYSLTEYSTIDSNEKASLVLLKPVTGRTHQLRLHLSSIGHSIIGDTMYGQDSSDITRQALHALSLTFPSAINGKQMTVTAQIPEDMQKLMNLHNLSEKK